MGGYRMSSSASHIDATSLVQSLATRWRCVTAFKVVHDSTEDSSSLVPSPAPSPTPPPSPQNQLWPEWDIPLSVVFMFNLVNHVNGHVDKYSIDFYTGFLHGVGSCRARLCLEEAILRFILWILMSTREGEKKRQVYHVDVMNTVHSNIGQLWSNWGQSEWYHKCLHWWAFCTFFLFETSY